jgi:CrcB protein
MIAETGKLMPIFHKIILIAIMGAMGTLCRYGLCGAIQKWPGFALPWSTMVANMVGCGLFGLIWTVAHVHLTLDKELSLIILIGFMGAFTTFSSFVFETHVLLSEGQFLKAALNVVIQNVAGLLCFWGGAKLAGVFA